MYLTDEDKRTIHGRTRTIRNRLSGELSEAVLEVVEESGNDDFLAIYKSLKRLRPLDVDRAMTARVVRFLLAKMVAAGDQGLDRIEFDCAQTVRDWGWNQRRDRRCLFLGRPSRHDRPWNFRCNRHLPRSSRAREGQAEGQAWGGSVRGDIEKAWGGATGMISVPRIGEGEMD